jgi:hypothetical protein
MGTVLLDKLMVSQLDPDPKVHRVHKNPTVDLSSAK